MKRVFFIAAVALTTLLASCNETPEKLVIPKEEATPKVQENVNRDNNAEMMTTQDSIEMARKKKMDSLEQVNSHGHAH